MLFNCRNDFFTISPEDRPDFLKQKFAQNNIRILFLASFLLLEQLYYGAFVSDQGSLIQKIHLFSSFVMLIYLLISTRFYRKKADTISLLKSLYELSFGVFGFLIAITRILLIQPDIFRMPTIFIAVIYGFAVIFYFHPIQSFFIYSFTTVVLIVFLPISQPDIVLSSYTEDILSNSIIAWIASIINYRKYVKEFNNQKIVEKSNRELRLKTVQIEKINSKLKEISLKDQLTDIYNRRRIDEILKYEYYRAVTYGKFFSVIMLDIDWFKSVNDTYGHNVGDKVLVELAEILRTNIRRIDTVGRWGGEEFIIICPETDADQALYLAERLREAIKTHEFFKIQHITCSFGVSSYNKGETIESIINNADKGLYNAKQDGRNLVKARL